MGNSTCRLRILLLSFATNIHILAWLPMLLWLFSYLLSCSHTFHFLCSYLNQWPPLSLDFHSRWLWVCWQPARGPSVSSHPSRGNQSSHQGSIRWPATACHGKSLNNEQSLCYTEPKQHSQLKHGGEQIALAPFVQVQSNSWHSPGGKALVQTRSNAHVATEAAARWRVRLASQDPLLVCALQRFNYGVLLWSLLYSKDSLAVFCRCCSYLVQSGIFFSPLDILQGHNWAEEEKEEGAMWALSKVPGHIDKLVFSWQLRKRKMLGGPTSMRNGFAVRSDILMTQLQRRSVKKKTHWTLSAPKITWSRQPSGRWLPVALIWMTLISLHIHPQPFLRFEQVFIFPFIPPAITYVFSCSAEDPTGRLTY